MMKCGLVVGSGVCGSLVPRPSDWGEGGEGLVSTARACVTFSVYFTVNVYRRYPYVIRLFKI